jgi:hypothetical protein
MTAPEPTAPRGSNAGGTEGATGETDRSDEPVMTLRGAGIDVDIRRAGRVVALVCMVALAVVTVVLFVAGAQKNAQINRLRQHGVPVEVTVTRCLGLMGGSGSNLAGFQCTGSFTVDGHHYVEAIPGTALYPAGAKIRAVTDPGDPALLSTNAVLATEQASWRVFLLPTILLLITVLVVAALALRQRRTRRR